MSDQPNTGAASLPGSPPAETLGQAQQQVEETRAQLGETIEALADKADVKAHAKRALAGTRERIGTFTSPRRDSVGQGSSSLQAGFSEVVQRVQAQLRDRPVLTAAGVSLVLGVIIGRLMGRH